MHLEEYSPAECVNIFLQSVCLDKCMHCVHPSVPLCWVRWLVPLIPLQLQQPVFKSEDSSEN